MDAFTVVWIVLLILPSAAAAYAVFRMWKAGLFSPIAALFRSATTAAGEVEQAKAE